MPTKSQFLKKELTLSALVAARQNILAEVAGLSSEQQNQIFLGIWSIKDLLAHLTGWDITNMEAVKSVLQSQVPSFYQYRDHDWQTYNAMLVSQYKQDSFQTLLAAVNDSHEKLVALVQTIPPANFNKDFGVRFRGYKVTIQRLLEAETKDEQTHHKQIIDFFKDSK
jgi:hypothetical protein